MARRLVALLFIGLCSVCNRQQRIGYVGILGEEAKELRASAKDWVCDSLFSLPGYDYHGGFLQCSGLQGDTQVAILSDTLGVVASVAREIKPGRAEAHDVFDLWRSRLTSTAGEPVPWCQQDKGAETVLWEERGKYSVLMVDSAKSLVNITTTLGPSSCSHR
jgi:hypothetical protein